MIALFGGCITKDGVFDNYYGQCSDYYDVNGVIHKKCDNKLVGFEELNK